MSNLYTLPAVMSEATFLRTSAREVYGYAAEIE